MFVVEETRITNDVVLTGQIIAEQTVAAGFRIGGLIVENPANVGDRIKAGQLIARLEPTKEQNALKAAKASLISVRGEISTTRSAFDRAERLMAQGFTTRTRFDQALKDLESAEARLESAEAQVNLAQDRLGFTELRAGSDGTVVTRNVEIGQTVQPGQTVVELARDDGRDAVFDVSAQVLKVASADARVQVSLVDSPSVIAHGKVREVSPQADPVTRTFKVRIGLMNAPDAMRLGSTVNGRLELDSTEIIAVPANALTQSGDLPAVWVVDPSSSTVSLRVVDIMRFEPGCVNISQGLEPRDMVVSAGVQALYPGQKVQQISADVHRAQSSSRTSVPGAAITKVSACNSPRP
ncbi:MAG: efflux RND transporter periplasmic adaptor subunit [Hyphomicrobiaceae bacterium]